MGEFEFSETKKLYSIYLYNQQKGGLLDN